MVCAAHLPAMTGLSEPGQQCLAILENKLQRAVTMLQNAYGEGKQVSARIRASAQSVQTTDSSGEKVSTEPLGLALVD